MDFENENINEDETNNGLCTFRKYENNPLLLLCNINNYTNNNNMYLKEIKTEINLSEINNKYNFKIQPYNDKDIIEFYEYDKLIDIIYYYPQVLDFTSQDEFIITYFGYFYNNDSEPEIPKIRLNSDSEDLNCQFFSEENVLLVLECVVPKSHFEGKKSGNYYTFHINDLNDQTILYQIPPIKVILNDESEEEEQVEPEEEKVEPEEEEQVEPEEEEQVEPEEEEQIEPEEEEKVEPEEEEKVEPEEEEQVEPEEEEEHGKEEESKDEEEYEEEEEGGGGGENQNNGGGKSSNTKTVLIIVFSVIGGILLLVAIFFLIHFLRKRNITKEDIEQGTSNRELLESQELKESQ